MMDKTEAPTEYVTKVAVKLPDFWFLHAEATFRNAQITQSKTKFNHIVQKLPQKIMVSVRSLIMGSAASSATPFKDLKAKLVSAYNLSRWQKVSKLIHHPGVGDCSHGRHIGSSPGGRDTR